MRPLHIAILCLLVAAALACGGGNVSSGGTPVAGASTLPPAWDPVGLQLGDGVVLSATDENVAATYVGGDAKALGDAMAKDLAAKGWTLSYDADDGAGGRTMRFTQGDATVDLVFASSSGTTVLSAHRTGTLPSGGSAPAPSSAASPAPSPGAAPAPAKGPGGKDCFDDVWYPCDQACGDEAWTCKQACDNTVTGECADACGEVEWTCKQACEALKAACEGG